MTSEEDKTNLELGVMDYVQKGVKTGIAVSPLPFAMGYRFSLLSISIASA